MPLAETLAESRPATEKPPRLTSELAHDRFHPLPHVVSARAGDTIVLMDRRGGTYHTLNEVGGRVWELIHDGATVAEVVDRLLEEYDVYRPQLEHDVAVTVQQLIDNRLLAPGVARDLRTVGGTSQSLPATTVRATELKVPSVLRCGLLIAWFKGLLGFCGFQATLEWISHRIDPVPATAVAELETVKAVEYVVAMAGALYPGRALCLEQSLVLWYYLRRAGVLVDFRMGVQSHPFGAHSWVEYRGEVVNDVHEHVKWFTPLSDPLA